MGKYLLQCSYVNLNCDDMEVTNNVFQIGTFDTLEDVVKACKEEIESQAEENALGLYDEDETKYRKEYISDFKRGIKITKLIDKDFARLFADRVIVEHWHQGGNYYIENNFIVTKIQ